MLKEIIAEKCKTWFVEAPKSLMERTLLFVTSLSNRFRFFKVDSLNADSEDPSNGRGLFGYEGLKKPADIPSFLIASNRKVTARIKHEIHFQTLVHEEDECNLALLWDELLDTLYKVRNVAKFVMWTHPQKEFVAAAEQTYFLACYDIYLRYTSKKFYNFIKKVLQQKYNLLKREPVDAYSISRFFQDFERFHYFLSELGKMRIVELRYEVSEICRANSYKTEGCHRLNVLRDEPESFTVIKLRLQLARLNKFFSYAEYALYESIAGTPNFVLRFLETLGKGLRPKVDKDYREITQHIKSKSVIRELKSYNVSFLILYHKRKILDIESSVKNYFSFDACIDGLNLIYKSLFCVSLEAVEDKNIIDGELWHGDVKKYCIQEGDEILGYIYFDIFARPKKSAEKTFFLIQCGRMCENGTYQKPIVVISLSLPNTASSETPLLNTHNVDILFREMGSAMHCIFGQRRCGLVCWTRCPHDLKRIPGSLMEYFASDPRILKKFARHHETKEVIPDDLIEKLLNYKKKFSAYKLQVKCFNALFDQRCHGPQSAPSSVFKVYETLWNEYFGELGRISVHYDWYVHFIHSSKAFDYSRLMSKAVATVIWCKYFKDDPLNQKVGKQYRNEFLSQFGAKPARALVENYLQMKLEHVSLSNALLQNL